MIPGSIRWWLPLSYAVIALVAALSLGAVLLTTLSGYYSQEEMDYLTGNAKTISAVMGKTIGESVPSSEWQSQVRGFAFLSQARVQLLDKDGQEMADSGSPDGLNHVSMYKYNVIGVDKSPEALSQELKTIGDNGNAAFINIYGQAEEITSTRKIEMTIQTSQPGTRVVVLPANRTLFGFGLNSEPEVDGRRSDRVVTEPTYDSDRNVLGYVKLSESPAYGRDIVDGVARGWAIAGVVAVLLATILGWLVSRRISDPLLELTGVSSRMARGDFSARAGLNRRDELGLLAHSFNEMANQVEETVVALRRFVADAAHELQTPLTALRTNLELVATEDKRDVQLAYAERAQAQVERLSALTGELLVLSRLEADEMQSERADVELISLVREVCEPYASRAEQANLCFSLDLPQEVIMIRGHSDQLRRALGNLLDNAVKFTPEGGHVVLGLHREGTLIEIWIEDSGIGIPDDDQPYLFERFHRGRNAAAYSGSGLGLAIAKAIVERHRGSIIAKNTSNGARFSIILPVGS